MTVCSIFSVNDYDVYALRLGMVSCKNTEAITTYPLSALEEMAQPNNEALLALTTSKVSSIPNAKTCIFLCLKISPRKCHYSITTLSDLQAHPNCSVAQSHRYSCLYQLQLDKTFHPSFVHSATYLFV